MMGEALLWPAAGALASLSACLAIWMSRGFAPPVQRKLHRACAALLSGMLLLGGLAASARPLLEHVVQGALLGLLLATPLLTLALLACAFREQTRLELASWQRDGLTGLLTRRALTEKVLSLGSQELGIVLLDIDHFKRINDRHLHAGGDAVLVHASRELRSQVRLSDEVGRHGGEEFCVLLPGLSASRTAELAERLVRHAREQRVRMPDGSEQSYTLSAGIAHCVHTPSNVDAWEALLNRADAALYAAKAAGRDRVGLCAAPASLPLIPLPHPTAQELA